MNTTRVVIVEVREDPFGFQSPGSDEDRKHIANVFTSRNGRLPGVFIGNLFWILGELGKISGMFVQVSASESTIHFNGDNLMGVDIVPPTGDIYAKHVWDEVKSYLRTRHR